VFLHFNTDRGARPDGGGFQLVDVVIPMIHSGSHLLHETIPCFPHGIHLPLSEIPATAIPGI
jgi:hypothetical protein